MFPAHGVVSQPSAAAWYAGAIAAYQPKGAASLAGSYVNLANPGTYDAAPGTAPTWDAATGWTFNGSTQYLVTGLSVGAAYTSIIRFSGATANRFLYGVSGSTTRHFLQTANVQGAHGYGNGSALLGATGFLAGISALAAGTVYQNGVSVGSTGTAFTGTSAEIYIGALNNGGSPYLYNGAAIQAVAIYNTTLTAAQVLSVSTAMAAL